MFLRFTDLYSNLFYNYFLEFYSIGKVLFRKCYFRNNFYWLCVTLRVEVVIYPFSMENNLTYQKRLIFSTPKYFKTIFTCLVGEQNTNLDSIKRYFRFDRFWFFFFIRWVAVRHVFLTVFLTAENLLLFPFRRSICRPSIVIIIHPISARNLLPNLPHTFRHYSGNMLLCNWDRDNSV